MPSGTWVSKRRASKASELGRVCSCWFCNLLLNRSASDFVDREPRKRHSELGRQFTSERLDLHNDLRGKTWAFAHSLLGPPDLLLALQNIVASISKRSAGATEVEPRSHSWCSLRWRSRSKSPLAAGCFSTQRPLRTEPGQRDVELIEARSHCLLAYLLTFTKFKLDTTLDKVS